MVNGPDASVHWLVEHEPIQHWPLAFLKTHVKLWPWKQQLLTLARKKKTQQWSPGFIECIGYGGNTAQFWHIKAKYKTFASISCRHHSNKPTCVTSVLLLVARMWTEKRLWKYLVVRGALQWVVLLNKFLELFGPLKKSALCLHMN